MRMGSHPFKVKIGGRVQVGSMDHGLDAVAKINKVLLRFCQADMVTVRDPFGSFFGGSALHHVEGIFRGGGI